MKNFDSMLPEDTKKRKQIEKQPSVTEHFGPEDRDAKPIPYSDKALEIASLEWVIQTNQVFHLYYIPLSQVNPNNISADSRTQACCAQKYAQHCISSQPQPGHSTPFAQAVKGTNHHDVQATTVLIARPPQRFVPSPWCCFCSLISC